MPGSADPLTRTVQVRGASIRAVVEGQGPVVVLESGLGGGVAEWELVAADLRRDCRVVRYDRPGLGRSGPAHHPVTAREAARTLRELLTATGSPAPYLLVGHSLGGLYVRAFTSMFDREVAGLVLVDPSQEDGPERVRFMSAMLRLQSGLARTLVHLGRPGRAALGATYRASLRSELGTNVPAEVASIAHEALVPTRRPVTQRALAAEFMSVRQTFADVRDLTGGRLPASLPATVISQGRPASSRLMAAMQHEWQGLHADLAASSPMGRHVIARTSGHLVPLDQPELVTAAVRDVLERTATPPIRTSEEGTP